MLKSFLRSIRPEYSARCVLEPMIAAVLKQGVEGDFQRGYAEALTFAWEYAGLPATAEFVAVRCLARAKFMEDA